jgi:dTDP-4-dehydrorhamnose reductase
MRILITGGSGLLGGALINASINVGVDFIPTHHCTPVGRRSVKMDIEDMEEIKRVLHEIEPDCVIHTAAMTNVDLCEDDPARAWAINAEATKHVADACNDAGTKLIYVSTDYVFDGQSGPYPEKAVTHPINVYGESKLAGERFTMTNLGNVVARVCVLYGVGRPNFVTWVIDSLRKNIPITVVTDQYNTPTYIGNCAQALLTMCTLDLNGTFHVSGRERVSRYEFARVIAEVFGLNKNLIKASTSNLLHQRARRPMDSSLIVEKAEKALGMRLANVREGLIKMKEEMQ